MIITLVIFISTCLLGVAMEVSPEPCPDQCDCESDSDLVLMDGTIENCTFLPTQLVQPHTWLIDGGLTKDDISGPYVVYCYSSGVQYITDSHYRRMYKVAKQGSAFSCKGVSAYHSLSVSALIPNMSFCDGAAYGMASNIHASCYCYLGPTTLLGTPIINRTLTFWDQFTVTDSDCISMRNLYGYSQLAPQNLSVGCNSAQCESICPATLCGGSDLYCTIYGCGPSNCNCSLANVTDSSDAVPQQVWVRIKQTYLTENLSLDPPCRLTLSTQVVVTCDSDQIVQLLWGSNSTILTTVNRVATMPIPIVRDYTSLILVDLSFNGSIYQDSLLLFPASSPAPAPYVASCWLCLSAYDNWSKASKFDRFMSVLLAIITVILTIASIGWVLMVVFWVCGLCGWTGGKLYSCCILGLTTSRHSFRFAKRQYHRMKKDSEPKANEPEEKPLVRKMESGDIEMELPRRQSISSSSSSASAVKALTAASMLGAAAAQSFACTTGATVQSSLAVCVSNLTGITCLNNANVLFDIPETQDSACLTWNSTTGSPVSSSKVEYTSLEYEATLATQYFTSDWTGVSYSSKSCYTPSNWCGSRCDHMNASDPTGAGHVSGSTTTLPGYTGCYRGCGCAGCSCFYCTSSCIAYRWAAQPVGEVCEIQTVTTSAFHPIITISTPTQNNTYIVRSAGQELDPNFDFSVVSTNFPVPPTILPFKVLKCPSGVYAVLASEANQMQPNTIGDIQGPSAAAFISPTAASFTVPTSLATPQFHQDSVTFQFTASGLSTVTRHEFPYLINGQLWEYDSGVLRTNMTSGFGLLMSAVATNYVTQRTYDAVCPVVSFLNGTGCFNCFQNASNFLFRGYSSCLRGTCEVSTSDPSLSIITSVITLENSSFLFTVSAISTEQTVNTNFTFTCSAGTVSTLVSATLLPLTLWEIQHNGSNGNATVVVESSGLSFDGFAFGNPLRRFVSFLVIMGIVLVSVFGIWVLWKYLPRPGKRSHDYHRVPVENTYDATKTSAGAA